MPEPTPPLQIPLKVDLGNLQICIRLITPADRQRILDGLQAISAETSYRRFFTPSFYPSEEELRYLTEADGEQHVALGALDLTRRGKPGVGAARYIRLSEEPDVAEAAVLVVDAYQRRGIGSLLLAALSRYAAGHGVAVFRAYVLEENQPFLRYLQALGTLRQQTTEGVVQIDLPVYRTHDALPETPETERARWAWQKIEQADRAPC